MRAFQRNLLGGAAALALIAGASAAYAEDVTFNIAPQPLASALNQFGAQSDTAVLVRPDLAGSKMTKGVNGAATAEMALNTLLDGTGLTYRREGDTFLIESASDPQSGSAAGDGADQGTVAALIVTAQKKEENIQDVPIAISAFTEKTLQEQKIEGGFDLLKAIPNVTFSKNNFTSYNFSIRGIGTKAVSATTDPGVSVSFNNVGLIQNRLFEQEYFDVERVEVLRGPQGTLYGRNATSGVINVISAKPNLHDFAGWIKGEVGNYHAKRVSAMVNIPLVEDKLAIRFAGALTDRQGYDYNSITKNHVNGRDLWSGRLTVGFKPTEQLRANLIWERFNEDDNRSRTGKQLCHHDDGPAMIGNTPTVGLAQGNSATNQIFYDRLIPAMFGQGCKPGNLYDDAAFGTPNGLSLPFVFGMLFLGAGDGSLFSLGTGPNGDHSLLKIQDPYGGLMQSRDLRTIASLRDPVYRAKADVVELNVDFDVTDQLTLTSQTAYDKDNVYSFQDFNRFNTLPIFNDTSGFTTSGQFTDAGDFRTLAPGGIFCDPQIGCSNTLAGFDISQAKATQFSQELRLQSSFDGPINFSVGANYTQFKTLIDYYVMYNLITAYALMPPFNAVVDGGSVDITKCAYGGFTLDRVPVALEAGTYEALCPYIDPNPVESINGEGHNYFRSKNPYKLKSWAGFGELYWNVTDAVKITAGLRYTKDRKVFVPVPSQVLMAGGALAGGITNRGLPEKPPIIQEWGEWTGRLGVDWKPDLSFTDQTMLYAVYSRGYKGGGANPPTPGFPSAEEQAADFRSRGMPEFLVDLFMQLGLIPVLSLNSVEYGPTFEPEFVNSYEIGSKNTLLDGALTLNADAFYYDYTDYQVSQIRDRTAVNENFDAKIWGLEFETRFAPSRNLQVIANLGYLNSRIADGETSIDIMNRTQGNQNYVIVKPWPQLPSNCVVPTSVAEAWLNGPFVGLGYWQFCGGVGGLLGTLADFVRDPAFGNAPYDPANYPELNGGAGLLDDVGGNQLPNAPHWTANIGAQYGHDILDGSWRATVRADAYWQSQSWARVYNDDPYDKLHGWYNVNLSVWFEKPEQDLRIELYAKNILDKTPITDAFLNSDDTALTTNVFVLDPRLIGLSIKKGF
jgi:outer membrane receptor protein involved in Fe transport